MPSLSLVRLAARWVYSLGKLGCCSARDDAPRLTMQVGDEAHGEASAPEGPGADAAEAEGSVAVKQEVLPDSGGASRAVGGEEEGSEELGTPPSGKEVTGQQDGGQGQQLGGPEQEEEGGELGGGDGPPGEPSPLEEAGEESRTGSRVGTQVWPSCILVVRADIRPMAVPCSIGQHCILSDLCAP